jgi:3-isopropylmalate/(R)-2-methylmalate dehydratase small subunit
VKADPSARIRVDVPAQTVTSLATGRSEPFELNAYKKYCLMNALDDIDYLLEQQPKIEAYERKTIEP